VIGMVRSGPRFENGSSLTMNLSWPAIYRT